MQSVLHGVMEEDDVRALYVWLERLARNPHTEDEARSIVAGVHMPCWLLAPTYEAGVSISPRLQPALESLRAAGLQTSEIPHMPGCYMLSGICLNSELTCGLCDVPRHAAASPESRADTAAKSGPQ